MTLDPGEGLVRIVVSLLYQPQLLPLTLVQARLNASRHTDRLNNVGENISSQTLAYTVDHVYLYASLSLSKARMSSLVSCLYDSGGKGMGENRRLSSQCTVVV